MNDWTNEHVAGHEPRSMGEDRSPFLTDRVLASRFDVDALGEPIATFTASA
jgi:hypothetical protein